MRNNSTLGTVLLLFGALSLLQAQSTFNSTYFEEFGGLQFTGVAVTDTAYYGVGVAARAQAPHYSQAAFLTFDLDGNVMDQKILEDTLWNFEPWCNRLVATDRGSFLAAGYGYGPIEGRKGFVAEYYPALDSIRFAKIGFDENVHDFFGTIHGLEYKDGVTYFTTSLGPLDEYDLDFAFFVLDENFEIIGGDYFSHEMLSFSGGVLFDGDTTILGSWLFNRNQVNFNFQGKIRLQFFEDGDLTHTYVSSDGIMWRGPLRIIKTPDGGLLMAVAKGYNYNYPSGPNDSLSLDMWTPALYKLSSDLEKEWTMSFHSPGAIGSPIDKMTGLVAATDGSGYVAAGYLTKIAAVPGFARSESVVAKVNQGGDLLWDRRYYALDSIGHDNHLNDIQACPDGGYLLGGLAFNRYGEPEPTEPRQQGWLLKLDEHGCLVPGCQGPVDATDEVVRNELNIIIAPNPVVDQLAIWLDDTTENNLWLQITNMQGQVLLRESNISTPGTYLKNVVDWSSGVYVLQVGTRHRVLKTEQWVKQ